MFHRLCCCCSCCCFWTNKQDFALSVVQGISLAFVSGRNKRISDWKFAEKKKRKLCGGRFWILFTKHKLLTVWRWHAVNADYFYQQCFLFFFLPHKTARKSSRRVSLPLRFMVCNIVTLNKLNITQRHVATVAMLRPALNSPQVSIKSVG